MIYETNALVIFTNFEVLEGSALSPIKLLKTLAVAVSKTKNSKGTRFSLLFKKEEKAVNDFSPLYLSARLSILCTFLGFLWIAFSDKIISDIIQDKEIFAYVSIMKGWAYVIVSSVVLFLLVYRLLKRIKKSEEELMRSYEELTAAHEELESLYEEIAASEEELKQQYDQLIENEKKMHYLAYNDTLTGLPNKLSLLENASINSLCPKKNKAAIFFVDMDNFKYVNDTMGHAFGDKFIAKVGEKLSSLLNEECSIYRIGGDEFVIILKDIKSNDDAVSFAEYILNGFVDGLEVDGILMSTTLSIGIAIYPEHGESIIELLKCADIAMYRSKSQGKNGYVMYDKCMDKALNERIIIEKHLRSALAKSEFVLYYQPQLDLKIKKIIGLEALLRWKSPELGLLSPMKFIGIAEDTRLIIPLGTWVLRTSCEFLKSLHQKGFENLSISVNISILQLLQSDFVNIVRHVLETCDLKPEHLELEITETMLMESFERIRPKLCELKELGVGIALDDFGKGYSSLSYLSQLPITTLKIDKSFIVDIPTDDESKVLIGQIIALGRKLGMCVVAEGVETKEQLQYLVKNQCDKIQGYIFSKPLPENEIIKLL